MHAQLSSAQHHGHLSRGFKLDSFADWTGDRHTHIRTGTFYVLLDLHPLLYILKVPSRKTDYVRSSGHLFTSPFFPYNFKT